MLRPARHSLHVQKKRKKVNVGATFLPVSCGHADAGNNLVCESVLDFLITAFTTWRKSAHLTEGTVFLSHQIV
jgi:hypothetical protein